MSALAALPLEEQIDCIETELLLFLTLPKHVQAAEALRLLAHYREEMPEAYQMAEARVSPLEREMAGALRF